VELFSLCSAIFRSPDIEPPVTRTGSGGWGLGIGNEINTNEEEDEPSDWEQAHVRSPSDMVSNSTFQYRL